MAFGPVNVGQAQQDRTNTLTQEQVGVPGGIATLGGDGKLTESQRPTADTYTKTQTDTKIGDAVTGHNSDADAHPGIRASVGFLEASVKAIELKYGTGVTENSFSVGFANLDNLAVTGVWNAAQSRIEF